MFSSPLKKIERKELSTLKCTFVTKMAMKQSLKFNNRLCEQFKRKVSLSPLYVYSTVWSIMKTSRDLYLLLFMLEQNLIFLSFFLPLP